MRKFSNLIFLLGLIFGSICCNDLNNSKNNPQLVKFENSECIDNCGQNGVISKSSSNDTFKIIVGAFLNCSGRFKGSFEISEDTLDLICNVVPNKDSLIELTSCNCYYKLTYTIKSLEQIQRTIMINGESFEENAKSSDVIELNDIKY